MSKKTFITKLASETDIDASLRVQAPMTIQAVQVMDYDGGGPALVIVGATADDDLVIRSAEPNTSVPAVTIQETQVLNNADTSSSLELTLSELLDELGEDILSALESNYPDAAEGDLVSIPVSLSVLTTVTNDHATDAIVADGDIRFKEDEAVDYKTATTGSAVIPALGSAKYQMNFAMPARAKFTTGAWTLDGKVALRMTTGSGNLDVSARRIVSYVGYISSLTIL